MFSQKYFGAWYQAPRRVNIFSRSAVTLACGMLTVDCFYFHKEREPKFLHYTVIIGTSTWSCALMSTQADAAEVTMFVGLWTGLKLAMS